jgi:hypothetical protein
MIEFIRMSKREFNTYFKEASRKYAEENKKTTSRRYKY